MTETFPDDVLTRPAAGERGGQVLGAWDDLPVHQSADLLCSVTPARPGWSERFYFNVLRPTGEIVAIIGGGMYPSRGLSECYFCRLDDDRQINVRTTQALPAPGATVDAGPFSLRCDTPLRDWSVTAAVSGDRFSGRFAGSTPPYLYETIDVPASEPGGEFDLFRHFVALGRWDLDEVGGLDVSPGMLGVRDRTWGVRTRRPRLHSWYVIAVGGNCLAIKHQELADGTVLFSEAGLTEADGRVHRLTVAEHDLVFDSRERQIDRGLVELKSARGPVRVEFERVGHGLRLAGAGYDAGQGERERDDGVQRDEYDLADPRVGARTGRGTIDAGVRAAVTGAWSGEGTGVVETAIARDHVRYGRQLDGG